MGPPHWRGIWGYSALAVFAFVTVPACRCGPSTSSPGFGVMAMKGPEVWTIDGKAFQVRATYFVVVQGRLQFTVDYLCGDRCPEFVGLSDDAALATAFPVMRYAVENNLPSRTEVRSGTGPMKPELIGVAITQQVGGGREKGYRVARTIEQVRAAMQAGGPGPVRSPRP